MRILNYLILIFSLGMASCAENVDPVFSSIVFHKETNSYQFHVERKSSAYHIDLYPENATCTFDSVDIAGGDFEIQISDNPCTANFVRASKNLGRCKAKNESDAFAISFGLIDTSISLGNPIEPIDAGRVPILCNKM
ncbi:MAG: hypothetical protein QM719_06570 [Thermomonas sp.]